MTCSSSRQYLSRDLPLMSSWSNITASSLHQFDLLWTMILLMSGVGATISEHRCSHSWTYSVLLGFVSFAVMSLASMRSSSRNATWTYLQTCLLKRGNCSCQQITTGFLEGDMHPTRVP